jgi:hypothetical protein
MTHKYHVIYDNALRHAQTLARNNLNFLTHMLKYGKDRNGDRRVPTMLRNLAWDCSRAHPNICTYDPRRARITINELELHKQIGLFKNAQANKQQARDEKEDH